jgi:sterol 14-demethylase
MIEDEVNHFMDTDPAWRTWQADDVTEWGTLTDVVDVLSEITILTASRTLQGREVRAGLDKSFAGLYTDLDGGFTPLNFMFPNLPLPSYRRRDAAQAKMSAFYQDIIRRRRAQGGAAEHDMLAALMEQTYRSGRALEEHEIAHIMIALLMAGQHTSSATGSWALLHLAAHPDVADALYAEQVAHFGQPGGGFRTMEYDELRELPILDSVIRETLRVHPPIHSIMRKVQDAVVVPGTLAAPTGARKADATYVVPAGHYVLASPLVSQMDPDVWRDATAWQPARWIDPSGVAAHALAEYTDDAGEKVDFGFGAVSKGTDSPYQPFGAGRHRCIGEQFAYLQLSTILATIVRRVELRLQGAFPEHNYHTMITMPTHPRKVSYRRRRHAEAA